MDKKVETAKLTYGSQTYDLPVRHGTVGPSVIDVSNLYKETGAFTYDPGFTSTASCESQITYIDGDEGELLYRGYPIDQLAEQSQLPRDLLPAALRRAADQGAVREVRQGHHLPHDAA